LGDLPRFALLEHTLTQPKNRPNLETEEGIKTTRLWSNQSLNTGAKWAWLKKKIYYNDDGLPTLQSLGITDIFIKSDDHETSPNIRGEFGVNLFGFAYGELGVGEDVRMAAMACDKAGIPYRIVNIAPGKEIRQADIGLKTKVDESALNAPYKINIFCMPGFDTAARIYLKLGEKVFKNHYNIGWWPWELSNWPKGWEAAFHLIDEVWAGSEFSYEMYNKALKQFEVRHGLKKSCRLMPLAVSIDRLTNSKTKYTKKYFGLPEKSFLFLYAFDFSSHLKRKNPTALVHAFSKAFPPNLKTQNPPVGLILKVMNVNPKDPNWIKLESLCSQDPRIQLLIKTLDRPEVLGLIKVCDAYVSPHRAEGFGRTLAEAMLMGKPVVATNYSGNTFFMHPEYTLPVKFDLEVMDYGDYHFITKEDEAVWASPNIDHLAFQLQKAVGYREDPTFFKNVINYAEQLFSPEKIGKKMIARLSEINL
jgi:glycosyltransferase involved in cell wall biosynthesis